MPPAYRKVIITIQVLWWALTTFFDLIAACFISSIAERRKRNLMESSKGIPNDTKGWENSEYCWQYVLQAAKSRLINGFKEAQLNQAAPNPTVLRLNGSMNKLLDFMVNDRPLIVNFGSCTWPPFMAKWAEFGKIIDRFSDDADFVTVYIEEAHASDGWKFTDNHNINFHRKLEDRIAAAEILREFDASVECPIVVDSMDDAANRMYGGLFERLYIVQKGIIVYEGERGPVGYRLEEVKDWLVKYTNCS